MSYEDLLGYMITVCQRVRELPRDSPEKQSYSPSLRNQDFLILVHYTLSLPHPPTSLHLLVRNVHQSDVPRPEDGHEDN